MTSSSKPSFNALLSLLGPDMDELAFQEYLSNLTRNLRNITLILSRQRPSDQIPVDTWSGILWIIMVPVIYVTAVAFVLGLLLLFFWYFDTSGLVSASPSEVSMASAATNMLRHDTIVVNNHTVDSLGHSVVLNYLISTPDVVKKFKISEASRGSTRSLGVLTERDLQLPYNFAASLKSKGFTDESRRLSKSIQECFSDRHTPVRSSSLYSKPGESQTALPSNEPSPEMADIATETSNSSESFSTDSLEENMSTDNLRASMDAHRLVWMASGEIRPEDLYGSCGAAHATDKTQATINSNRNPASTIYKKSKMGMHDYADEQTFSYDTNDPLKKTNQTAGNAENNPYNFRLNQEVYSRYKSIYEDTSSHNFPSAKYPRVFTGQTFQSTPQNYDYSKDTKLQTKSSEDRGVSVTNAGTNVCKLYLNVDHPPNSRVGLPQERTLQHQIRNFQESFFLQQFETNEDSDLEEPRSLDRAKNSENYELFMAEDGDLNISSVSQMLGTSEGELEHSKTSMSSEFSGRDESSLDSPANSLPSSIARFHSSKLGLFPAPSAGYPLDITTDSNFSQEVHHTDDSQSNKITEKSSLSANFGSCSQSPEISSVALLSQEESFDVSQDGRDSQDGTGRHEQKPSKLTKRPSPLSSFVNNIRQRYSFDENFLKCRRGIPDDEEAIIRSPLIEQENGTNHKRHQSLDIKGERISAEQRLQEFGLLKSKGKNKYFINPLPGRFETGAGYYNYVFTNNENPYEIDSRGGNNTTPNMQPSARDIYLKAHSAPNYKYGSFDNILDEERSQKFCQVPPYMDSTQNYMPFEDDFPSLTTATSSSFQHGRQVIEIHSGPSLASDNSDPEENDRRVRWNAREFTGYMIDFTNQGEPELENEYKDGSFGSYESYIQDTVMDRNQSHFNCEEELSNNSMSKFNSQCGSDTFINYLSSGKANERVLHSMLQQRSNPKTMGNGRGLTRQHTSRALVPSDGVFS